MMIGTNTASRGDDEFAADVKAKMVSNNQHTEKIEASHQHHHHHQHDCDILLNNFQIKKKRYKVLLNYDHIVWERLDVKHCQTTKHTTGNNEKTTAAGPATPATNAAAAAQKEAEYKREQLSHKATYGNFSNVVHLHEVIRVAKGNTKSATVRNAHKPLESSEESQGRLVTTPTEQYLSVYYAERVVASPTDCNRWHIRRLTLHNSDPYIVAKWYDNIQKLLRRSTHTRIKRLLVFINPFGGRKMGLQIYERSCKPAIQLAGIDASCIITQRANQIRDILMSHDLTPFDAVCCVGGDGTIAEMINGLVLRAMQDQDLNLRRPGDIPKPALPLGFIPAGSTDTIVYSLHGTSDVQTAAIHLVLGHRRGLDVCSVSNRDGIVRFCTSGMSYGYLGDVAAKSEKYRWMGPTRYEYTGVKSFLRNRGYEAEVRMLLNEDDLDGATSPTDGSPNEDVICNVNCETCKLDSYKPSSDNAAEKPSSSNSSLDHDHKNVANKSINKNDIEHSLNFDHYICDKDYSTKPLEKQTQIKPLLIKRDTDGDDSYTTNVERPNSPSSSSTTNDNTQQQNGYFESGDPQTTDDIQKWRVIRGEFFWIAASNTKCACSRSPNGLAKYCHLGDGHLDLILVRKTNLINNVRLLINVMLQTGDIRTLPFVEVYRTKQFIFKAKPNTLPQDYNSVRGSCQPIADSYAEAETDVSDKLYSSWNCDGEVLNDLEITMTSHRQLIDVFMRGPYIYSKPLKNSNETSIFSCCHSDS